MIIQGVVIRRDNDPRNEVPVADAVVSASDGVASAATHSDASGYFKLTLKAGVWPNRPPDLAFRHPDYKPLDLKPPTGARMAGGNLFVAAMTPNEAPKPALSHPVLLVSNVMVRYTVNSHTEENIGSAVRTFQVVNKGNLPCRHAQPCSPDGRWKASTGAASLDAGSGNKFLNVRASCIAGPCPFTRLESINSADDGRTITVSALNWSDTATFLIEAEVFRSTISSSVRESYPVIFNRTLNFTVPPTEEGVSLEATIDDTPMVFPLSPDLYLSWATCTASEEPGPEKPMAYRCALKPGYTF